MASPFVLDSDCRHSLAPTTLSLSVSRGSTLATRGAGSASTASTNAPAHVFRMSRSVQASQSKASASRRFTSRTVSPPGTSRSSSSRGLSDGESLMVFTGSRKEPSFAMQCVAFESGGTSAMFPSIAPCVTTTMPRSGLPRRKANSFTTRASSSSFSTGHQYSSSSAKPLQLSRQGKRFRSMDLGVPMLHLLPFQRSVHRAVIKNRGSFHTFPFIKMAVSTARNIGDTTISSAWVNTESAQALRAAWHCSRPC
mmetsp:Transcript_2794/g.8361  ORF Transcript_2794/g.8361 Transcript_2794/m.8361 type:complete len:253 (+) Transcript_2794:410-1168(+)